MAANPWITTPMYRANRNILPEYDAIKRDLGTTLGRQRRYDVKANTSNDRNALARTSDAAWRNAMMESGYDPAGNTPVDQWIRARQQYLIPTMRVAKNYSPGAAVGQDDAEANRQYMLNYLIGNTTDGQTGYNPTYDQTKQMLDSLATDISAMARNQDLRGASMQRRAFVSEMKDSDQQQYETFINAMAPYLGGSTDYLLDKYNDFHNQYTDAMQTSGENTPRSFVEWFWQGMRNR